MRILGLNATQAITNENLTMSQRFTEWARKVTDLSVINGSGSPEGVQEAQRDRLYRNTDAPGSLWIKTLDEIGQDTKLGWIKIGNFAGNGDKIVPTDVDYQIVQGNLFINCAGALSITAIDIADAFDEVTITATSGICTFVADATIQSGGSVPNLTSVTFYPARLEWWRA